MLPAGGTSRRTRSMRRLGLAGGADCGRAPGLPLCWLNVLGAYDMAWVIHNPVRHRGKSPVGNGECAVLAQWFNSAIPHTCHWRPGEQVSKTRALVPGTVIATFNQNGDYVNRRGFHTAIYVGRDAQGITVIEQFHGLRAIRLHKYHFGDPASKESNGDSYYVVEHKHDKSWHHE